MQVCNNYGPLEMTRSEKQQTSRSVQKNRVESEPGDEGLLASPAPGGLVCSTYDASRASDGHGRLVYDLLQNVVF